MTYRAVLFDLFDTLVRFDRERMPEIQINGKTVRSSAGMLHGILITQAPQIGLEACYEALGESWREAERLRALDHREVSALDRFAHFFRRLGLDETALPVGFGRSLIDAHRGALGRAAEFPPHHGPLLRRLAERYRLAVVSNFDYTPTVRRILAEGGILGRFETVVVSDTVGWRKPRPDIFARALDEMGLDAKDCLFVGDRPEIDVAGAKGMGMAAAWLNVDRAPLPPGLPAPDLDLGGLPDLRPALEPRPQGP
jgi:FMN phosphatase YigB (HAD superfamily)